MAKLTARIDVATAYTGSEKVPPLVEAAINAQAYTKVDFDLWKNVVHVVVSDEAVMKAAHDILALNVNDAAKELSRMENSQIATEMATATEVAGSDWETDTNDPFDDITPVIATILENGYTPSHIAMHPLAWADFISNSNVQKYVQAGMLTIPREQRGQLALPIFPDLEIIVDSALLNTSCFIVAGQGPALVLGAGPTESAKYRNEPAGYDAFIIRQWLQPQLVLSNAIRELTGVHA